MQLHTVLLLLVCILLFQHATLATIHTVHQSITDDFFLSQSYTTPESTSSCSGSLSLFPTKSHGKCLDGTPGGYWYKGGKETKNFLIDLEGGGECVTKTSCTARSKTALGSSNFFPKTRDFSPLLRCDDGNPMHEWNKVFVGYCSGDLFYGQDHGPSDRAWGLQFSGYHLVMSTIDELWEHHNLAHADNIVLSGDSAGGLGAVVVVDAVFDYIFKKIANNTTPTQTTGRIIDGKIYYGPKVAFAPVAGFHFANNPSYKPLTQDDPKPVPFIPWDWVDFKKYHTLWNAYIPQHCHEHHKNEPYKCLLAEANWEYIHTPGFIIQSTIDSTVLPLHSGVPTVWGQTPAQCDNSMGSHCSPGMTKFMHFWHTTMNKHIYGSVTRKHIHRHNLPHQVQWTKGSIFGYYDGVFASACLTHTDFTLQRPLIGAYSSITAFWEWYNPKGPIDPDARKNPFSHSDHCPEGKWVCGHCHK